MAPEAASGAAAVCEAGGSLPGREMLRSLTPVEKAKVSARTKAKAARKQTAEGLPVHSLRTLLADPRHAQD